MPHNLRISEIMATEPITIHQTEMVSAAEKKMREADIRHLPVIDAARHVVGVISDRDVLRTFEKSRDKAIPVRDVMSQEVLTVHPETRACEATALMLDRKISSLPVVDAESRLIGVVTETDFLRVVHNLLGGDRMG